MLALLGIGCSSGSQLPPSPLDAQQLARTALVRVPIPGSHTSHVRVATGPNDIANVTRTVVLDSVTRPIDAFTRLLHRDQVRWEIVRCSPDLLSALGTAPIRRTSAVIELLVEPRTRALRLRVRLAGGPVSVESTPPQTLLSGCAAADQAAITASLD